MIEPKQVLEQKHMAELKEAFQYIDHDGDGLVDEQDLMELLPALGMNDVNAKEMLKGLPGKLNFSLFLTLIQDMLKESRELAEKLSEAMEILDDDGDGQVDIGVLEEAIPGISEKVSTLLMDVLWG